MKKTALAFAVTIVLVGMAFVPAVAATPPIPVSGIWQIDESLSIWNLEKVAGANKVTDGNYLFTGTEYTGAFGWTGDFSGSSIDYFRAIGHKNGVATARFTIFFAGTVCGSQPGTMVLDMGLVYTTTGRMEGSWVIKDSAGGLAGLKGEGQMVIDWNPMGSYSGKVHWEK